MKLMIFGLIFGVWLATLPARASGQAIDGDPLQATGEEADNNMDAKIPGTADPQRGDTNALCEGACNKR